MQERTKLVLQFKQISIEELNLSQNKGIKGKAFKRLAACLFRITGRSLRKVNLSNCRLDGDHLKGIMEGIKKGLRKQEKDLKGTKLQEGQTVNDSDYKLQELDISENPI